MCLDAAQKKYRLIRPDEKTLMHLRALCERLTALQEELDAKEYEITAGGGVVTIKINGKKEIMSIDIKPEIVDPDDIETLTDVLTAGINEAIKKVEDVNTEEMSKITGGISMPGLF